MKNMDPLQRLDMLQRLDPLQRFVPQCLLHPPLQKLDPLQPIAKSAPAATQLKHLYSFRSPVKVRHGLAWKCHGFDWWNYPSVTLTRKTIRKTQENCFRFLDLFLFLIIFFQICWSRNLGFKLIHAKPCRTLMKLTSQLNFKPPNVRNWTNSCHFVMSMSTKSSN